jgi:hypothetical protein
MLKVDESQQLDDWKGLTAYAMRAVIIEGSLRCLSELESHYSQIDEIVGPTLRHSSAPER